MVSRISRLASASPPTSSHSTVGIWGEGEGLRLEGLQVRVLVALQMYDV